MNRSALLPCSRKIILSKVDSQLTTPLYMYKINTNDARMNKYARERKERIKWSDERTSLHVCGRVNRPECKQQLPFQPPTLPRTSTFQQQQQQYSSSSNNKSQTTKP
mmetsp:Transcript_21898/g.42587  ORF Transcript_21898/g.42587 Transcript_21898/m.42587 type:complete len:107 (-) Transcript_21898:131-451(-)